MAITAEQMTQEQREAFSEKVHRTLRHLLVDQMNRKLSEEGADFEYVIVYKEPQKEPTA